MAGSLELLEEKFRQVEQASERRILDGPDWSRSEMVDSSTRPSFYHRRAVVAVSQFGKLEEQEDISPRSLAPSPLSAAASRSSVYRTLASPRSFDSFLSTCYDEGIRDPEELHETRVEKIIGRQTLPKTVGALLPRRLTGNTPQLDRESINMNLVVDVSVETTTESSFFPPELKKSTVYATRPRSSTVGTMGSQSGLVERARDFARKLGRKSRADLL